MSRQIERSARSVGRSVGPIRNELSYFEQSRRLLGWDVEFSTSSVLVAALAARGPFSSSFVTHTHTHTHTHIQNSFLRVSLRPAGPQNRMGRLACLRATIISYLGLLPPARQALCSISSPSPSALCTPRRQLRGSVDGHLAAVASTRFDFIHSFHPLPAFVDAYRCTAPRREGPGEIVFFSKIDSMNLQR